MAETALVTGGGGFLGQAIIRQLIDRGLRVHSLNRGSYPELSALGVHCFQGDIADPAAVRAAAAGCTLVFHVAAKAGVWGAFDDYYRSNVLGTRVVLATCKELGISRLIYTSSPSVTFDGQDQEGIDETTSYPQNYEAYYPETKAQAEREILAANSEALATVALRPHLIWGPGDHHIIPRILDRARRGRLRLIGSADKLVDAVYIDNAAQAHLCAMDRLTPGSEISGKAFYITNHEPWPTAEIINGFLEAAGLPPVRKRLSMTVALRLARVLEWAYTFLGLQGEPPLTRFTVKQLGTAHWYKTDAARDLLGYTPRYTMREGMLRLKASLQQPRT